MVEQKETSPVVVVIGAGPVGLALAIELGTRSISCLVLEKDADRGPAPRAKTTNVRTRELMRRWGIADDLARAAPFGIDYPAHIHFVTRLNGHPIVRFDDALFCKPQRDERFNEHSQWVPQYTVEKVLKAKALSLPGVELRYGTTFIDYAQDVDGVRVRVQTPDGGEEIIRADYLVGADGAASAVRTAMGVTMEGRGNLSRNFNIIFRAPGLMQANPQGPGIMYWMMNTTAPSAIGPMDKGDLWYFGPTRVDSTTSYTHPELVALIKEATGIDLPYEIVSADIWHAHRLLATRYSQDRVFLVGDACHLHPPFGGYGMNMGVADAVDLGWKMAAVLQGWGGRTLLDSYEAERRPVHEMVLAEAESNHAVLPNQLFREGIEADTPDGERIRAEVADLIRSAKQQEFYALGVVLGLRYRGSPVIPADGTEASWVMSRDYIPDAAPGCLAPHAWLDRDRSLYDLFGQGFTLLVFDDQDASDIAVARTDAKRAGVPLTVVILLDPRLSALYGAARALIRPDQFVAWRGDQWPADGLMARVTGQAPP